MVPSSPAQLTAPNVSPTTPELPPERSTTVEVNGKRFDVRMWVPETVGVIAVGDPVEVLESGPPRPRFD